MRLPIIARVATALVAIAFAARAQAAPLFYLSTESVDATPGRLNLTNVPLNSTDIFHIWADTDARLSGVSLELVEAGGAIKFRGFKVHDPVLAGNRRWSFFGGPPEVTGSVISNIGGALLPGPAGNGIGPGAPDGPRVLFASVDYMALNTPGAASELLLRIGRNIIAVFDGNFPQVRFGTESSPLINGDAVGAGGVVGSIQVGGFNPPVITPIDLGEVSQATTITANLVVGGVAIWSENMTPLAGSPAIPATLDSNGKFTWDPTGSKRGPIGNGVLYSWSATAISPFGSTTSLAISLRLIPEPATMTQFGLTMLILGSVCRRSPGIATSREKMPENSA